MGEDRFFEMLGQVPRLSGLWNESTRSLDVDEFERELGVMSSGEYYLAQFFAAVWFGDNKRFGFDLVCAGATLDVNEKAIIVEWLADPFWP